MNLVKYPIDPSTPQFYLSDQALFKRKDLISRGYYDETEDGIQLLPRHIQKNDYSHLLEQWEKTDAILRSKYYDEFYQNLFHAAVCCQKGFSGTGDLLLEAHDACDRALSVAGSFTVNILKHIVLIGMGDIAEEYKVTWANAIELAKGDQEMVVSCFKDLWYRRHQRSFQQKVVQYYDDFG